MKTTIYGIVNWAIMVITIVIVLFICNNHSRSVNLQDNLQEAVESSLNTAMCNKNYTIDDADELIADMIEGIAMYLNDSDKIDVTVKNVDMEKGLLSVVVTEHYTSVKDKVTDISCEKTVLLDRYATYTVTYGMYDSSNSFVGYKTYEFSKKQSLIVPKDPDYELTGKVFRTWALKKSDGTLVEMTNDEIKVLPSDKDYTFIAQFE